MSIEKLPLGTRLVTIIRKIQRRKNSFQLNNLNFKYFINHYNKTYNNERTIEVSLAKYFFDISINKQIIELGNVSKHYLKKNHRVIDKYEKSKGVENIDFLELEVKKKYDFLSLSTIEHIGFDEFSRYKHLNTEVKSFQKKLIFKRVFEKINQLIDENSKLLVTAPIGYNQGLDEYISLNHKSKDFQFRFMKRINMQNQWVETSYNNVKEIKYSDQFPAANAIVIISKNLFNSTES